MNRLLNKNSLQKLASLVGVASTSVLLGLPVSATINSDSSVNPTSNADSSVKTGELLAQQRTETQASNEERCEGYIGNMTTGGGYYCGRYRYRQSLDEMRRQGSARDTLPESGRSTTGEGFPGNGQSTDTNSGTQNQQRNSLPESGRSTTGEGFPGNGQSTDTDTDSGTQNQQRPAEGGTNRMNR